MSDWLDANRDILDRVERDLKTREVEETGRKGLSVESVLRCGLLKQYRQLSYDELVFCLLDSTSCQTFARLTEGWTPKKTALQQAISLISQETWEEINRRLLQSARASHVERGEQLRIDSTVTEAPIHEPSDSSLLGRMRFVFWYGCWKRRWSWLPEPCRLCIGITGGRPRKGCVRSGTRGGRTKRPDCIGN
jgi:IS5 family transposase